MPKAHYTKGSFFRKPNPNPNLNPNPNPNPNLGFWNNDQSYALFGITHLWNDEPTE